jgi:hypothetical protein
MPVKVFLVIHTNRLCYTFTRLDPGDVYPDIPWIPILLANQEQSLFLDKPQTHIHLL